jgi:RNA polymerase sigma-70 factor (ECF subfamily)
MKTTTETIWLEHNKELNRFVLSKIKDKDISKDILQDVFLKLHSKIDTLKSDEKIKPWLYQITRNTITDYFRKQKFSVDADELDLPMETEAPKTNEQFSACVKPHLNKLPLIYKEAIMKTEFGNYSQLQLAEELNISYSGAKSRVQRAKELLKSYFKQCCNVSTDKYGNILSHDEKHECKLC